MRRKDKFYTSKDLTGHDLNDRLYSESEVQNMEDLFSEYFSENSEYYNNDVDAAYSDFFDAYSASGIKDETPKDVRQEDPKKVNKKAGRAAATGAGLVLGASVGAILSRKDKAKKKLLVAKISSGNASKQDLKDLSILNAKIKAKTIGGAALGAGAGYATAKVASKLNTK